jgi:hypothetical protein
LPIWAVGRQPQQPAASTEPPPWEVVFDEPPEPTTPREWAIEALIAFGVAVALVGLSIPLAYLWAAISPHVVLEMTPNGPAYTQASPEQYIGGETIYYLITFCAGILSAFAVWLLTGKRRGPVLLAGLVVGSVVGATLMAWYGQRIGLDEYQRLLEEAPIGMRFEVPVKVRAAIIDPPRVQGAVLLQALLAVATYTLLAGFYSTASLRPERERARIVPSGDTAGGAAGVGGAGGAAGVGGAAGGGEAGGGGAGGAAGGSAAPDSGGLSWDSPGPSDHRVAPGPPAGG